MKYRKTYLVEALQFTGDNLSETQEFIEPLFLTSFIELQYFNEYLGAFGEFVRSPKFVKKYKINENLETKFNLNKTDWLAKGFSGCIYCVKDEIFKATYEAVNDEV